MKNTPLPDDSGGPWNTDELVYQNMTCKELAKFCTSYMACLRMAVQMQKNVGPAGVIKLISAVLEQQAALIESESLTDEDRIKVNNNSIIAIQAACMAAIFAVEKVDPRHLAAISAATIDIVHGLIEKSGPLGMDDAVLVKIRKGPPLDDDELGSNIQMGVQLEPVTELASLLSQDNIGKEIKKIAKKTGTIINPDRAKFGHHGNN